MCGCAIPCAAGRAEDTDDHRQADRVRRSERGGARRLRRHHGHPQDRLDQQLLEGPRPSPAHAQADVGEREADHAAGRAGPPHEGDALLGCQCGPFLRVLHPLAHRLRAEGGHDGGDAGRASRGRRHGQRDQRARRLLPDPGRRALHGVTDYLDRARWDPTRPDVVAAFDELPLWSAMAGVFLLEHLPLVRGARVLDVGCGTGFPLLELAQRLGRPATVHGLDRWAPALERARFKAGVTGVANATLTRGDGAAMPFRDARFDLVVSNLGINNFADPDAVFRESRRVLQRRGRLALTTNVEGHMAELYTVFEAVLKDRGRPEALEALRRHVANRGTAASIAKRLGQAGFRLARAVERDFPMRFADGSALLRHYFVRLGFLDGWRAVTTPETERDVFAALEEGLNRRAAERGVLALTVPLAYVEAEAV